MAKRNIVNRVSNLFKKKEEVTTQTTQPNTASVIVTDYTGGGSKVVKTESSPSTGKTVITTIKKSSPSSAGQVTQQILQTRPNQQPTVIITSKNNVPLINRRAIRNFQQQQQARLIRPLRPIKTLENIGNKTKLLQKLETTQRNLETKELRSLGREKQPLKSMGRQAALFGLSFTAETLRGVKGFINLPKNIIKTIPKLPAAAVNLVKNRKNIIPMSKLRFKSFKSQQGYLLKTSPSSYLGKVGANIFLFKASGEGLKLVGKGTESLNVKFSKYLTKLKKEKVIFKGIQVQEGNKIYSAITFKSGKKIYGFAIGESKIGKSGKLIASAVRGKAFKLKSFASLREQPINFKKVISFTSQDIGKVKTVRGVQTFILNDGVTAEKAVKRIIQVNTGRSAQTLGKSFKKVIIEFPTGKVKKVFVKNIEFRNFFSKSRIFTKKDISIIIGKTTTNRKEIINYLGAIKTLRRKGESAIITDGGRGLKLIKKQNLVNIAAALSTGQVGARKILSKLSPAAKTFIQKNIQAGIVLIPKTQQTSSKVKGFGGGNVQVKARQETIKKVSVTAGQRLIQKDIAYFKVIPSSISSSKTNQKLSSGSAAKQQQNLIEILSSAAGQKALQKLTPRQAQRLKQNLRQYLKFYPKLIIPLNKVIPFKIGLVSKSKSKVYAGNYKQSFKTGYLVYGLNKKTFIRLNRLPLLKPDALSRGAYAIDRTKAKVFKIVPVLNVVKFGRIVKREKGYFTLTKPKFREFKIVKGQKKIFTYTLVEKKRYGRDSSGEKKGLSLYQYLSRLKKQGKY